MQEATASTESQVIDALRSCYDPEIPVNVYDLGLVYEVKVSSEGEVSVRMTLTAPSCPVAGSLPGQIAERIKAVPGVKDVKVDLVWQPAWNPSRMSAAAKLQLGMDLDYGSSDGLYGIGGARS